MTSTISAGFSPQPIVPVPARANDVPGDPTGFAELLASLREDLPAQLVPGPAGTAEPDKGRTDPGGTDGTALAPQPSPVAPPLAAEEAPPSRSGMPDPPAPHSGGSFLGGAPRGDVMAAARQIAEIFNEHGLMQGPAGLRHQEAPGPAARNSARSDAVRPARAAPAPSAPDLQALSRPATQPARPGSEIPVANRRHAASDMALPKGRAMPVSHAPAAAEHPAGIPPATMATDAGAAADPVEAAAAADEPADLFLSRLLDYLRSGRATDAQILIEVAERGIRLAARTGNLTPDQKLRLREQIALLLASHGFRAEEIRLNGDAGPQFAPIEREDS